ncbi:MAG: hypothetical protein AABW71_00260 [Nanoarchaeota archaeon]
MVDGLEKEKAQIMFKLARKNNWGHKYDRLEHFKRFQHRDLIVKELSKQGWLLIYSKPNFLGISLNTEYKRNILHFIESHLPEFKGMIR